MNESSDHHLINIRNREMKLRAQQHEILKLDAEQALEKILDAKAPVTLVQSFPDQDLYYLMHKIGPYDFIPVLSMASSEQWEYLLDVEIWDNDRLDVTTMTRVMDLLFQADPKRILRWGIKEKPALFEFFLSGHMTVAIREHDELPPSDYDDYITIDDKFYFRFPEKPQLSDDEMAVPQDSRQAWELIEQMLKKVADMDLSVFHGLLLETQNLLPAEVEEEEFRLKNLRLAEKGFLPTHEAIGIYQPTPLAQLRQRQPLKEEHSLFNPDIPLPPQFFNTFSGSDDLFTASLSFLDPDFLIELESEMAALINKVISADKIKLRSRNDLEKATQKTRAYIHLGLEMILKEKAEPSHAHKIIQAHFLEDIFRTASRACIRLKSKAEQWFDASWLNQSNLPLSFLGETYLGLLGGLFLDRPLCFDPMAGGDLFREFNRARDIDQTRQQLDEIMALDMILGKINADTASFMEGVLTYKTLVLTLWAKDRLGLEPDLSPISADLFKPFFSQLFSGKNPKEDYRFNDFCLWIEEQTGIPENDLPKPFIRMVKNLMEELNEEYSGVSPDHIDPRFIPHFLLKN